jgi:hypothetical protein
VFVFSSCEPGQRYWTRICLSRRSTVAWLTSALVCEAKLLVLRRFPSKMEHWTPRKGYAKHRGGRAERSGPAE